MAVLFARSTLTKSTISLWNNQCNGNLYYNGHFQSSQTKYNYPKFDQILCWPPAITILGFQLVSNCTLTAASLVSEQSGNDSFVSNHNEKHNSDNTSYRIDNLNSMNLDRLYQYPDYYALTGQLIFGLLLNLCILCSILLTVRQLRDSALAIQGSNYPSFHCTSVPVIDIILALMSVISLLKLFSRTGLQIVCFHDICLVDNACYIHGFVNTFLHHIYLWTVALFLQDRYIKHYKLHDYICKCSNFVLYVTLTCVMFLTIMHLCAPIYGFSTYSFVPDELTCSIDWYSRYSCPYFIYTMILILLPAFVPILYWTGRLTYRNLIKQFLFGTADLTTATDYSEQLTSNSVHRFEHQRQREPATKLPSDLDSPTQSSKVNSNKYVQPKIAITEANIYKQTQIKELIQDSDSTIAAGKHQASSPDSIQLSPIASSSQSGTKVILSTSKELNNENKFVNQNLPSDSLTPSASSIENSSSAANKKSTSIYRKYRQRGVIGKKRATINRQPYLTTSFTRSVGSSFTDSLSKSNVLTESKEIKTITLCSWIFVLSYAPNLLKDGLKACSIPDDPAGQQSLSIKRYFYISMAEEFAACILIPFVLVVFHSKLRLSVTMTAMFCYRRYQKRATKAQRRLSKQQQTRCLKRGRISKTANNSKKVRQSSSITSNSSIVPGISSASLIRMSSLSKLGNNSSANNTRQSPNNCQNNLSNNCSNNNCNNNNQIRKDESRLRILSESEIEVTVI